MKNKWLWLGLLTLLIVFVACSNKNATEEVGGEVTGPMTYNPPSMDDLDPDDPMTEHVLYGQEVFNETNTVLEDNVGNELSCMSCHADGGLSKSSSMVGVTTQFPEYRPREGVVFTLEDRINSSIVRSLNGEKIPEDSEEMRALIAYLTYVSSGIKSGEDIPWRNQNTMNEIPEPSVENGEELYEKKSCMSCHATDGAGTGADSGPALWGDNSFNDGAEIGRLSKMAGYIKSNMPPNGNDSLTDQEAADLSAFILSRERPVWENHDTDWQDGDRPTDIITQERRVKIRKGTFDWTEIENVIPAN